MMKERQSMLEQLEVVFGNPKVQVQTTLLFSTNIVNQLELLPSIRKNLQQCMWGQVKVICVIQFQLEMVFTKQLMVATIGRK